MTTVPLLDELPDYPNPDSVEFEDKIGPFTAAFPVMVQQFNASITAYNQTVTFPDGQVYQVQEDARDTTAGRLLQVGAFGLGGSDNMDLSPDDNLDDLDVNGPWRYQFGTVGAPSGGGLAAGVCIHWRRLNGSGTGFKLQTAYDISGAILHRVSNGAGWEDWEVVAGASMVPKFAGVSLSGYEVRCFTETIADNAVATFTPPKPGGTVKITANANTDYPLLHLFGEARFDAGASLLVTKTTTASGGNFDVTTGTLTGTTGTDGNVTFSVKSDGTVQIENRSNGPAEFCIKLEG